MPIRPLKGLFVVALEQAVAAPYCTSRLADAGARVIKVERAEGDFARGYDRAARGLASYFVWLNRGKESVVLDIKADADRALLSRMIARADVFVQNLAPGAAARAGFGSDELRRRHPGLVCCNISGYGESGPYCDRKAYDLLLQAETGLSSITGGPEGPGRVGVSVCDIACGMYAYAAILEALMERGRTGQGRTIDVSLFDAMADWMAVPLLQYEATGDNPARVGLNHVSIAPYGAYACGDGEEVLISIQNEREWRQFCAEVLARPELASDPRFSDNTARVANRPALNGHIDAVFGALPRAEVIARLDAARIAFASINSVADFAAHPHLRRTPAATPAGEVALPAAPAIHDGETRPFGRVPALGEHTEALRAEFADAEGMAADVQTSSRPGRRQAN
ncbi:MAG TPA: CaiB/BaiF CoA-transferase family protein [Afifellaceae bacterium]|nr:CaiB/BaiF CoA-transferase family protein [Afifellaceae bacterium]